MDNKTKALIAVGTIAVTSIAISTAQQIYIHNLRGAMRVYHNGVITLVNIARKATSLIEDEDAIEELASEIDNELIFFEQISG